MEDFNKQFKTVFADLADKQEQDVCDMRSSCKIEPDLAMQYLNKAFKKNEKLETRRNACGHVDNLQALCVRACNKSSELAMQAKLEIAGLAREDAKPQPFNPDF